MDINSITRNAYNKNTPLVMHILEIEKQASAKGLIPSFDIDSIMEIFYHTRNMVKEHIKNKICFVDILKTIYRVIGKIFKVSGREPSLLMAEGLQQRKLDCDLACGIYLSITRELNFPLHGAFLPSHAVLICKTKPFICFDTLNGCLYNESFLEINKMNTPSPLSDQEFISTYYNTIGVRFAMIGKHKEAIFFFNKALKCYSLDARLYYHKAISLAHLGNYKQAMDLCEKAIELNPSDWKAHFNMGVCFAIAGKYKKAVDSYNCARKLQTKRDYRVYYHLADALLHLGQLDLAIRNYKLALRVCPSDEKLRSDYETAIRYSKEP